MSEHSNEVHTNNGGWWTVIIAALVVGVIGGIVVGIQIGKGSSTTANTGALGSNGQQMGGFGMRGGTMGTVTAISADSITVKDTRRSTSVTYTITSSTTVADNGSTSAISNITVGDSVIVQSDTTDSTSTSSTSDSSTVKTAVSIELNPSLPSGAPGTDQTSSSSPN